jgi:hypothetical protein
MHAHSPKPSRSELETLWRGYVCEARKRYDVAAAEFARVLNEQQCAATAAGWLPLRLARLRESMARTEYMRVLKIFTDLVVSGTVPEERAEKGTSTAYPFPRTDWFDRS